MVDHDVTPPAAVRVADLAFGREHSLALSAQKELWAWGSGCQLGLVTATFPVWRPQKVSLCNQLVGITFQKPQSSVQVWMLKYSKCLSVTQVEHLAGRHVIQVCCSSNALIHVFIFTKIKFSHVYDYTISPQVVCGAYHSLALVRSLPNSYSSQKPSEKSERSHSPLYSAAEREELFGGDSGHYCPLGVELTEGMAAEVSYPGRNKSLSSTAAEAAPWLAFPDFFQEEMSKAKAQPWRPFSWQQPRLCSCCLH